MVVTIGFQQIVVTIGFQQIAVTCSGFFGSFLYPVQEFRLKNDTQEIVTTHIGLYGIVPLGRGEKPRCFHNEGHDVFIKRIDHAFFSKK